MKKFFLLFIVLSAYLFGQPNYWRKISDKVYSTVQLTPDEILIAKNRYADNYNYSTNYGKTWYILSTPTQCGYVYKDRFGSHWATDANKNLMVKYAGTNKYIELLPLDYFYSIYVAADSSVYVSADTLYFSSDYGNTWVKRNFHVRGYDINGRSDGTLFLNSYYYSVYKTTDKGITWNVIYPGTTYNFTIHNDTLYSQYRNLYRSVDMGDSWQLVHYDTNFDNYTISSDGTQYGSKDCKVFISEDSGVSWEDMGYSIPEVRINEIIPIGNKLLLFSNEAIFEYDPDNPLHRDENYFPLAIGNKWQYLTDYPPYTIYNFEITDTVTFEGEVFYKHNFLGYLNNNKETGILKVLVGNPPYHYTSKVANMLLHEHGIIKVSWLSKYYDVIVSEKEIIFNNGIKNNVRFDDLEDASIYQEYLGNWGLYKFGVSDDSSYYTGKMNEALVEINGELNHYKKDYDLDISGDYEFRTVPGGALHLNFVLDHELDILPQALSDACRYYIDKVTLKYFYQKDGETTDTTVIEIPRLEGTNRFETIIQLDINYFGTGYHFSYQIIIKDKAIIPNITKLPSSGWYNVIEILSDVNDTEVYKFSLAQNYPNPFNPETVINYSVAEGSNVLVEVFNLLGEKVTTLVNEYKNSGEYSAKFNAVNLPAGLYLYRITTGKFVETKKMLLLK